MRGKNQALKRKKEKNLASGANREPERGEKKGLGSIRFDKMKGEEEGKFLLLN